MVRKLSTKEILQENLSQTPPKGMEHVKVVLHNIRSMHNVGSVFRSGDAFGISEIILSGYSPTPPRDEITKTAIGAEEFVDWRFVEDILAKLLRLKSDGYTIIGLEQTDSSVSLLDVQFQTDQKICIVMGNEVSGIDADLLPLIDTFVVIPQFGQKHSLNVSVATGVTFYAILDKYYKAGSES
ncbi:MAG: RNA methyltransferase [Balneolaceae bacterium]|nr:RNA methyltransferase [Balneolaceae bacterium]